MRIDGYLTGWDVEDEAGLERVLAMRDEHGGAEFWLGEAAGSYPCLAIRVSGNHCDIHFFPKERHPGFRCLGGQGLPEDGLTTFVFKGCQPGSGEEVPNVFVVPFATALSVAKEFLRTRTLPSSATWFEL